MPPVSPIILLAPIFLVFEVWQLVMSERYLGVKRIAAGTDPREVGPSELVAAVWTACLVFYGLWMATALAILPSRSGRAQAVCMLLMTLLGYALRRNCTLKYVLVVLTFEGAIRIGMLISLLGMAWRRL
ncbi:hypothetical protein MASR2M8_07280 [Opitutaceae bacterium]